MLVHWPSGPVFPTGAGLPPIPLIVILTVLVDGPELFASATLAQRKMAVKDSRRDLYMLLPLFVSMVFNQRYLH